MKTKVCVKTNQHLKTGAHAYLEIKNEFKNYVRIDEMKRCSVTYKNCGNTFVTLCLSSP